MSETQVGNAQCLCGSVSIQAEAMSRDVHVDDVEHPVQPQI